MEIIREEISSYLGENEPMYASPQDQQREVNDMLNQVENLKKLRDELDAQIAQLETIANTFNVNEDAAANKAAMDAKKTALDKEIAALNKQKQALSKPGTTFLVAPWHLLDLLRQEVRHHLGGPPMLHSQTLSSPLELVQIFG